MGKTIFAVLCLTPLLTAQKFYPDDPLLVEPAPVHVQSVLNRKLSDYYDLFSHQFAQLGERQPRTGEPIRAKAVNTLGEPMDGAWWVRRHYYQRLSLEELQRGPGNGRPPAPGKWTVVGAKAEGITPGFTILDDQKRRYFVKFDPATNPEMATSADAISTRFFYALGYHVPENYLVYFSPDQLVLGDDVQLADATGKKRRMTERDIYEILVRVPKTKDGRYRATASLAISGKPVGPPRYYGTRKDDPNDTTPHENRRDLSGLHVFCAWLAHDDSRAINNFDALVKEGDRQYLKHYLLDLGSTLGSGSQKPNSPRSGAYFFDWRTSAIQLFTLGLRPPYWARAKYRYYPSVGLFEGDAFRPDEWVPEYHNPAFLNRLPDDEFWGAKQVAAFTDEEIRAVIRTGELSNPEAAEYLAQCLIKRRDKIRSVYFSKVLPYDRFAWRNGRLEWSDLSGALPAATVQWARFDNQSGATTDVPSPAGDGYFRAVITHKDRPRQSVHAFLRMQDGQAKVVGIERFW